MYKKSALKSALNAPEICIVFVLAIASDQGLGIIVTDDYSMKNIKSLSICMLKKLEEGIASAL